MDRRCTVLASSLLAVLLSGACPLCEARPRALAVVASPLRLSLTDAVDSVDAGNPADRRLHLMRWVRAQPVATLARFGQLQIPIRGIELQPGGVAYASLRTAAPLASAVAVHLATKTEHHGKLQSYSIELEGHELCSEATVDPGAGTSRTVFAESGTTGRVVTIAVRAGWRNTFPIVLEAIRVYRRPDARELALPASERWRMGLALLTSRGHGFHIDAEEMRRIGTLLPNSEWTVPQAAVLYNFCTKRDYQQQLEAMQHFAGLAVDARLPLRVLPQMHWAGIPSGIPDGAGGTFTDVPYQQITWDPDDQTDDPGLRALLGERYDIRYGLSIPNRWGNTPWLTFNHPRLNQYRRIRLKEALRAWLAARERLARIGLAGLFPPELSTGEETVYWAKGVDDSAYTQHNGGKPRAALLADFNPFVVAEALADGVILDPSNGLDRNERWWLHQNLSRWQQTIVNWMLEAVPPEPIRMTPSGPVFAGDLVRRNIFTEPYAMPVFPMRGVNPLRPGLEAGYVREGRSGGEYWSGATMLPWLVKERERGRIALPNLECTGADDGALRACLLAAFACGARYATLYNWHYRSNIRDLLAVTVGAIGRGASRLDPVAPEAVTLSPGTAERVFRGGPDAFGVNVLTAVAPEGTPAGTTVRLTIRSMDERLQRSACVTVPVAAVGNGPCTIAAHLPVPFHVRPAERYAVMAQAQPPSLGSKTGGVPTIRPTGAYADVRLERWRSFAVADWQDAADLIAALDALQRSPRMNRQAADRLELARTLMRIRKPEAAYQAGIRAEQLLFPCSFVIGVPGGKLAPFSVSVECPTDRVRVTIHDLTPRSVSVSLVSSASQVVYVRYRGSRARADLAPNVPVQLDIEVGR